MRPGRRAHGRWLGGLNSIAIHGMALAALALCWRFPVAPVELSVGRLPMGFSWSPSALADPDAHQTRADPTTDPPSDQEPVPPSIVQDDDEIEAAEPRSDPTTVARWQVASLDGSALLAAITPRPRKTVATEELRPTEASTPAAPPSASAAARAAEAGQTISRILKRVDPVYPRPAMRAGRQGAVRVRMIVGGDGHVISATADDSSGSDDLDQAALTAVRQWEFESSILDRQETRLITITIRFQLGA